MELEKCCISASKSDRLLQLNPKIHAVATKLAMKMRDEVENMFPSFACNGQEDEEMYMDIILSWYEKGVLDGIKEYMKHIQENEQSIFYK